MINLTKKGIFSIMLLMMWGILPVTLAVLTNYLVAALSLFPVAIVSIYLLRIRAQQLKYISQLSRDGETQLTEIEKRVMTLPDYFHSIFNHSHIGIAILSLDGYLIKVNPTICYLFGYSQETMLRMQFQNLISSDNIETLQQQMQELIEGDVRILQTEQQCYRKDNEAIWMNCIISLIHDVKNKPAYYLVQIEDITLQKKAEERLRHMAYHDPLTGLANRNRLEQFINRIMDRSHRYPESFALLFVDLDRFKSINDTIGHEAGDLLLQIIADRLKKAIRNTDLAARLGGDEFVVVVTDVYKSETVAVIAEKILQNIREVIFVKGKEIYITASIGISLYPLDGQNMQTLMKNADLALYRAKDNGRNNYQFYMMEMTKKAQERMALQNSIGDALRNNELQLYYQPIMEIQSQKITGMEALLRWNDKEHGMVAPDEIISLAEETGLIIPISEWIFHTACKHLKHFHNTGFTDLTISINCSARQFKHPNMVSNMLGTLGEMQLLPHSVQLEVTERLIMQDPENIMRVLYSLKDFGMKIAIDDFGTGYWSLNNLRRMSVDSIKIDKTFIKQMTTDTTSADIVSAIIAMVSKLGIKSVAEGVETREQYEFLHRQGCNEIQGYYLAQPMPEESAAIFLKDPVPDAEVAAK